MLARLAYAQSSRRNDCVPSWEKIARWIHERCFIIVRQFSNVVLLRYQAELEMPSQSGGTSSFVCWHTDSYELHNGLWQVVFSQATRIG